MELLQTLNILIFMYHLIKERVFPVATYDNCFAYIFEGEAKFDYSSHRSVGVKVEKSFNNQRLYN